METQTKTIIQTYLTEVKNCKKMFEEKYGVNNFMKVKYIERTGILNQNPKITFYFHGLGCTVTKNKVDVELNASLEYNQFDLFFLKKYAKCFQIDVDLNLAQIIDQEINELLESKTIKHISGYVYELCD